MYMPSRITENERLARAESQIHSQREDIGEIKDTLKAILEAIQEIREERAKERGFLTGMCFAYGSLGVLMGAGIDYLLHRL